MSDSEITLRHNIQAPMSGSTEEKAAVRNDSRISRIEELIRGRTFSREEINSLLAVLNSRVDSELEKEPSSDVGGHTEQIARIHGVSGTPTGEKRHVSGRTMSGTFSDISDIPVGVGASPIDIARAYMAGRTLEQGRDTYMPKGERTEPSNKYLQQPLMLSPLPRPSICWPGAMVDEHHHYTKSKSQSSGVKLHDFPRTPYSRTITSRSMTKLRANSSHLNTLPPFQQSHTPVYGQEKVRCDNFDGYGSVGPIRRIRNMLDSEIRPRRPMIHIAPKEVPAEVLKSNALSGFLPSTKKNLEPGETSGVSKCLSDDNASGISDKDASITNPSSSPAVRKILEHLGRNNTTVKEKEADVKLLTSWGMSSPECSVTKNDENLSSLHSVELASHKKAGLADLDIPVEFHKNCSNSNVNSMPSFGLKGYALPTVKNSDENALDSINHGQDKILPPSSDHLSNGLDVKAVANSKVTEFSKNDGNKPLLPSIFINKPGFGAGYSENGPGFTFPISTASGIFCEPPTPTIMPSSASIVSEHTGIPTVIPSNSFGTNKPSPRIVFAFPSASNAPINDASDLKFSFGSDKRARFSFSSFECH